MVQIYIFLFNKLNTMINNSQTIPMKLEESLKQSERTVNGQQCLEEIRKIREHSQTKIYNLYTAQISVYFGQIWSFLTEGGPEIEQQILIPINKRINIVSQDIANDKIRIEEKPLLLPYDYEEELKNQRLLSLRHQSDRLKHQLNEVNDHIEVYATRRNEEKAKNMEEKLYVYEKKKQIEEFLKNKKKQKEQRKKRLEEIKKKEEEDRKKKEQEEKMAQKKSFQIRKQETLKEEREKKKQREEEKMRREQRNSQYLQLKKNMYEKPPLYQKIQDNYIKNSEKYENEKKQRAISERKSILVPIKRDQMRQHSRRYQDLKDDRQRERQERIQLIFQQEKSRIKYHSSYQLKKKEKEPDPDELHKQQAKAKIAKMNEYKAVIKEKHVPKIDEKKRKQLMNLIQEMELAKKPNKRIQLENGSIIYEELREGDPKIVGMDYLEQLKELTVKYRKNKRSPPVPLQNLNKPKDYLNELKKSRQKHKNQKISRSYGDKKNLSYDERRQKVLLESEKLTQETKQTEMKLKFGKFKTSDEILACKEEIDKNYIDIVNMKMDLILNGR